MWLSSLRSESFQEAFRRFERVIDIDSFDSYRELVYAFERWCGKRWVGSYAQFGALAYEAKEKGFEDAFVPKIFYPRIRKEKWVTAYERKVKRIRRRVRRKYVKSIGKKRFNALSWYVSKGYSANKIQRMLQKRGLGLRRKKLLKIVREMRLKAKKKYRRKKR